MRDPIDEIERERRKTEKDKEEKRNFRTLVLLYTFVFYIFVQSPYAAELVKTDTMGRSKTQRRAPDHP
jgi:hypothetical protein